MLNRAEALITIGVIARSVLVYCALSLGCFLMLKTILGYASFRPDVQFLLLKQNVIGNPFWLAAFYVHVFSAVIALFAGFTQFSAEWMRDHRGAHRLLGRVYVITILIINVPAGMIMAIYANGGWIGKSAFITLDLLWFSFTYQGYLYARRRDFLRHRQCMIRSYALTLSALTLRSWKLILSHTTNYSYEELYLIDAWLAFLPNIAIAEIIIRWPRRRLTGPG